MGGASLFITGKLLGHKTPQMTEKYAHLVPDVMKKALDDVFLEKTGMHYSDIKERQLKKALEIITEMIEKKKNK